jgi:hypothetical protein
MRLVRWCSCGLGIVLAVHSMPGMALAGGAVAAPEIDGNAVTAGFGLLAAGVLLLRARKSR